MTCPSACPWRPHEVEGWQVCGECGIERRTHVTGPQGTAQVGSGGRVHLIASRPSDRREGEQA